MPQISSAIDSRRTERPAITCTFCTGERALPSLTNHPVKPRVADPQMTDEYAVLSINSYTEKVAEPMGTKTKYWVEHDDGSGPSEWLFKIPRSGTGEHWAEKAAYELAKLIDLPAARVELATLELGAMAVEGTASQSFTPGDLTLVHGNELLDRVVPGYDKAKRYRQKEHRIDAVFDALEQFHLASPPETHGMSAAEYLVGYVVFDGWIANVDRHHENWAVAMNTHTEMLYVGWYDSSKHFWYPVGQVCTVDHGYRFEYLRGALQAKQDAGFRGIFQFPDLHQTYEGGELFAFFSNRMLTFSRDNFAEEVARMGFDSQVDALRPFDVLSRTNGRRVTDTFEVYPPPRVEDNTVELVFFARGVRYLPDTLKRRWEDGEPPQGPLRLEWDDENEHDTHALRILDSEGQPLGFLPRYYSESFHQLVDHGCDYRLEILRHNRQPGFVRERFLMTLTSPIFEGWYFPQSDLYDSIAEQAAGIVNVA